MARTEFTLHDVSPRFQKRLLGWLLRHGGKLTVRTTPDGQEFMVSPPAESGAVPGEHASLERAMEAVLSRGRATLAGSLRRSFQTGVRRWLTEHDGVLSIAAAPSTSADAPAKQCFLVEVSAHGVVGSAVDEDFEMALLEAEDLWEEALPASAAPTVASPATGLAGEEDDAAPTTLRAPLAANRRGRSPDEDPAYVLQGLHTDGTVVTEYGFDQRAVTVADAKRLARDPHFEGDYVRVITRDGEPVWDSRDHLRNVTPPPLPPLHGRRVETGATIRRMVHREEGIRRRDERRFDPEAPRARYAKPHHFAVNHARTAHPEKDILREVVLGDTGYTLVTWDTGRGVRGKTLIGYALYAPGSGAPLFEGADVAVSPMHAIDSDETLRAVMTFLTLRRGDTDRDYFKRYTPAQLAFAEGDAEELQLYALRPEEGGSEDAFVDVT